MKPLKLGALALATMMFALASPAAQAAQTRTLPAGDTLYAIDCEDGLGELVTVDVSTAVLTAVGEGYGPDADCAAQSAYDADSGIAYWVAWADVDTLFSLDPTTGESTLIGSVETGIDEFLNVGGLMIGQGGTLFALYSTFDEDLQAYALNLASVNKSTGTMTFIAEVDATAFEDNMWSSAYNPADNAFYFIDEFTLYRLNVATGAATSLGNNGSGVRWNGLAFDSEGTMWSTGRDPVESATIDGWTSADDNQETDAPTTLDGDDWYSGSPFIVSSGLAETGAGEDSALALGVGSLLLIGSGVLMVANRRTAARA